MGVKDIVRRLERIGIPMAMDEFRKTKQNPLPSPPFIIYTVDREIGRGSDERLLLKETQMSVGLYTDRKRDEALEERIVKEVLWDTAYEKYMGPIDSEDIYQTIYEFTLLEKMRRN